MLQDVMFRKLTFESVILRDSVIEFFFLFVFIFTSLHSIFDYLNTSLHSCRSYLIYARTTREKRVKYLFFLPFSFFSKCPVFRYGNWKKDSEDQSTKCASLMFGLSIRGSDFSRDACNRPHIN